MFFLNRFLYLCFNLFVLLLLTLCLVVSIQPCIEWISIKKKCVCLKLIQNFYLKKQLVILVNLWFFCDKQWYIQAVWETIIRFSFFCHNKAAVSYRASAKNFVTHCAHLFSWWILAVKGWGWGQGRGLSQSVKNGKFVTKILFSDNDEWSSENFFKNDIYLCKS